MSEYDCIINGLHFYIYQSEDSKTTNIMVDDYTTLYTYNTHVDTFTFETIQSVLNCVDASSENIGIKGDSNIQEVDGYLGKINITKKYEYILLSFGEQNIRIMRDTMTGDPVYVLHRYVQELRKIIIS